ncbi:HNH endonuclease [Lysinibacillus sp. FSL L8-0312]|uniref:HNH endonuclease n=1 Tax=Lysinibacillus sp. FSL L8-0312 TaxID=2921521 RepID=UPI0030F99246
MIGLKKLNKPAILIQNANEWTELYLAYKEGDENVSKTVGSKYSHKEVKKTLIEETHGKCAYCESKILHISFGDIEHIVPKSEVPEKCFQWDNLTLACTVCNNNKRDFYDVDNLLIDPYIDDPNEHFYFAGPMLIEKTEKAILTRSKLDLNRAELFEDRTRYLENLSGFTMQIQSATNPVLREALFDDFRKKAKIEQEYCKMVSDFLELFESKYNLCETSYTLQK